MVLAGFTHKAPPHAYKIGQKTTGKGVTIMRVKHEEGYQAILYKNKEFDLTPIAEKNKLKDLVSACEKARDAGVITAYIIRHVEAKYVILTDVDLEMI